MKRRRLNFLSVLLTVCASFLMPVAEAIEFSADAYQQTPLGVPQKYKMFVGTNRVRKEYMKEGAKIIEIYDLGQQKTLVLYPANQTYTVKEQAVSAFANRSSATKEFNPCAGLENTRCTKVGIENVNGHSADKWRLETRDKNQLTVAEYWIDRERVMVLKEHLHDSTMVEMRLLGYEMLQNRKVEKWERLTTFPNLERFSAIQWYDNQLGIFVREEIPGGYLRELSNIRAGSQSSALFEVPAGYKMINQKTTAKGTAQP